MGRKINIALLALTFSLGFGAGSEFNSGCESTYRGRVSSIESSFTDDDNDYLVNFRKVDGELIQFENFDSLYNGKLDSDDLQVFLQRAVETQQLLEVQTYGIFTYNIREIVLIR